MLHPIWLLLMVIFLAFSPVSLVHASQVVPSPTPGNPEISSPLPGEALQGVVPIEGVVIHPRFLSAELAFSFIDDPTGTWFLIARMEQPTVEGTLAQWDTTVISDGSYTLRLVVILDDGSQIEDLVPGVRVRNYSPIETDTPFPTASFPSGETPIPTVVTEVIPTSRPPTATPLPPNQATVSRQQVTLYVGKGALTALGMFALGALYSRLKTLHKGK